MELITLNNAIVGMRPRVMQARLHVIRHHTRNIAKIRAKKTKNDAEKAKNERKAERLVQEIMILKDAKKDDITKFSLSNTRVCEDAVNQLSSESASEADVRTRAYLRVAEHPSVAEAVKTFRDRFSDWETSLKRLVPKLGVKQSKKSSGVKRKKAIKMRSTNKERLESKKNPGSDGASLIAKQQRSQNVKESRQEKLVDGKAPTPKAVKSKAKPVEPAASLHPSWAAKKEKKTKILPHEGKKIVFGGD